MKNATLTKEGRLIRVAVVGMLGVFLALFAVFPKLMPFAFCGFHRLTGLPCPFCGGTRAARAILHGDFLFALYLNPLAFGVLFFLAVFSAIAVIEALRGRSVADWEAIWSRRHRIVLVLLILGLVIWWPVHITSALRKPKTELVNFDNPVAASLRTVLK